jgi:hypothetical protein
MQDTPTTKGAPPVPVVPINGRFSGGGVALTFEPERVQALLAALEEPFDVSEIKWRVTNTTQVGSKSGPRYRGQMLAYADPRAYTDRLNDVFTATGWTRDYNVQMVQNFERRERGATERTITAKIVVTCKVTVYGLGAHTGLGEEWADNDNAGTAAEAQAFKRACSCFGLGRYLYDLEGQWVDLDEKKRPFETPKLPEWARPQGRQSGGQKSENGNHRVNGQPQSANSGTATNGKGGLYRGEVLEQVKELCDKVGFSLSNSVLQAVAKVEDPEKISDMVKLTAVFDKLHDTERGVDRLRAAVAKVGNRRYAALCQELNLASDAIDDIPDRMVLRRLVEILEGETNRAQTLNGGEIGAGSEGQSDGAAALSELRGRLLQQASRVSGATRRTLAQVITEAANGAFTFANLKDLRPEDAGKVHDALAALERIVTTA